MFSIVKEYREMITDRFIDCDDVDEFNSESEAIKTATTLNQTEAEAIASDSGIPMFTSYVIFSDSHDCIEREDLGFSWEHVLRRTI